MLQAVNVAYIKDYERLISVLLITCHYCTSDDHL